MSTYSSLLEAGWKLNDIDSMDILGFLHVRAWKLNRDKKKNGAAPKYIDQVWKQLRP